MIDPRDLKIDTFNPAISDGWVEMVIIHKPTAVMVEGKGRSRLQLEQALLEELERVVAVV